MPGPWGHGRPQGLEQGLLDPLARIGDGREPRNRLAAPDDGDQLSGLDPIDELAQAGLRVGHIDRFHVMLLTMWLEI
jgi:hypothetical protein